MRRPRQGFTLIEIMIVILIISILMLLVLPNLVRGKYQAQWSACMQEERHLAAALECYNADEQSYPATLNQLLPPDVGGNQSAKYIAYVPTCPSNESAYAYEPRPAGGDSNTNDSYTISCTGVHYLVMDSISQGYPQYNAEIGLRQRNASE